jgi:hypothetical protein
VPRNVYIAIMKAAKRGAGLRLTADECHALSLDDAIATAASNFDHPPPPPKVHEPARAKIVDTTHARQKGRDARRHGLSRSDPYKPFSATESRAWYEGYDEQDLQK